MDFGSTELRRGISSALDELRVKTIDLENQAVRTELIRQGWTPPRHPTGEDKLNDWLRHIYEPMIAPIDVELDTPGEEARAISSEVMYMNHPDGDIRNSPIGTPARDILNRWRTTQQERIDTPGPEE
jgi:hypothetical protein